MFSWAIPSDELGGIARRDLSICQLDSKRTIRDSFPRLGEQSRERSGSFQNATEDNAAKTQESDLSASLIRNQNIQLSPQGD
jgi:hypothetical protein